MTAKLTRREMLKLSASLTAGAILASCAPAAAPTTAPAQAAEATKAPEPAAAAPKKAEGKIVAMWNDNELVEAERKLFMQKYPNFTLEFLTFDEPRLMAMLAAGNPPDHVRIVGLETPYFASRKIWLDQTPYIMASTKIKMDDLLPVNDMNRYEGGLYGIVKDWSPDFSLWINHGMMAEAGIALPARDKPISVEWLRDTSAKLTKKEGDRTLKFGFDNGIWDGRFLNKAMIDSGSQMWSDSYDKVQLRDNPKAKDFLKFLTDWAKEKTCTSPINPATDWGGPNFASGLSAIICQGYWYSGFLEQNKSEVKAQMYPAWSYGGDKMYNPCGYGCSGAITRGSKNPDAAWAFQEYFMAEEPAITRAKSGWGVPALKSQLELMPKDGDFRGPLYEMVNSQVKAGLPPLPASPFARMAAFDQPNAKYQEMYLRGEISFEDYIGKVEDETNATISDEIQRRI
jgi:multiple sugar transport system substrate-binding protein